MRLYQLLGGKHIFMCKASGKLGQSGGMFPPENFDFGPFIRRNLVESGTCMYPTWPLVFNSHVIWKRD